MGRCFSIILGEVARRKTMEEEKLTLSSPEWKSCADFIFPSRRENGGKPPPWLEEQTSQRRKEFGGLDQASRVWEEAEGDSLLGVPTTGRVWSVRWPPPTQVE